MLVFQSRLFANETKVQNISPIFRNIWIISDDSNGKLLCLQFTSLYYSSKNTFLKLVFIITECKCSFL